MPAASPWWTPDVHADRRGFLIGRNRIQAALRAFFAARDFIEVDTATLQVSPGNEAHLHAFATQAINHDGSRRAALSPHLAGVCLQETVWPPVRSASPASPMSIAIASAGRCTIRNSPCSNGIARARPTRR